MARFLGTLGVVAVFVSAASAQINIGGGWQANVPGGGDIGIFVDQVGPDFVEIQISKDFTEPPVGGVFPPKLIDFVQIGTDANTVPRIIINDEAITNLTGTGWTDYHWAVLNLGEVYFDVPASNAFSVTPFDTKVFSDPLNVFGDPNKATDLDAFNGFVPNNGSFFPGLAAGELDIVADLSSPNPVSFTFKQFPTPEPSGLLLIVVGAALLKRR